jgi:anaerobic selenocysteine-containing dehydrogenase
MTTSRITFCRICEASCGLIADVEAERVVRLRPDPEHVVSRGFACIKGIRYLDVHESPDRLRTPLKRVGDRYEPISWAQALAEIGAKVRALRAQHGRDSVGVYIGNPAAFTPAHMLFAGYFTSALGTRHLYTSGSQDCNNKFVASEEMFGAPMLQPIPDFDRARFVMMLGANPAISQLTFANVPRVFERLKDVHAAGGRVVFVNPRRTESSRQLGELLFIRPGTDVYFILAFGHVILDALAQRAHVGLDALARHTDGYEQLRDVVAAWPPERVAAITGIAPERIRELAQAYLAADGAVLYAGTGVNQGPHGTLSVWLLHAISIVSGNLDRPGGMLVTRQMMFAVKMNDHGRAIKRVRSRVSEHRSVLESLPAGVMPDEILTPGEGQLRALFVTAGNPVLTCPNSPRMQRALEQLELLVSIDLFRNETGNLAHYLLPASSFLERSDVPLGMSGYQPIPYAQFVEPVVAPLAESRDEWWIFAQLARESGLSLTGSRLFQTWLDASTRERPWLPALLRFRPELMFAALSAVERVTLRRLRREPHGVLLAEHRTGKFMRRGVFTENRKVQLAPATFVVAARKLDASFALELAELEARPALRLIGKRERQSHNSWMHNVESFVSAPRDTNYLYMHPDDAAARGLRERDLCTVRSATGQLSVPLKLTDELMQGTVALPHGWGHQHAQGLSIASRTRGVNSNLLSPDGPEALEALSGMARLTAIEVEVEACQSELAQVDSQTEG